MELLKEEIEHAGEEAKGQDVQVGFKVFRQLMLHLHPDFDIRALEGLITPEVVVIKVEEEVAIA